MADERLDSSPRSLPIRQYNNNVVSGGKVQFGDSHNYYDHGDIIRWLDPPNVLSRQEEAQRLHKDSTGSWLLESKEYQLWKNNDIRHIWLHGKAGCGKSILCSTVIQDLLTDSETSDRTAFFYFSFAEKTRQSYESLLRTLVSQFSRTAFGRLVVITKKEQSRLPTATRNILEDILVEVVSNLGQTYICIDALDECPEDDADSRDDLLNSLPVLLNRADGLKLFMTSRRLPEISEMVAIILARPLAVDASKANADIAKFVNDEMQDNIKLRRLDSSVKDLIRTTFQEKANGMFRWAFCQMQDLKRLRITSESNVRTKLATLPKSLDETYERMLHGICQMSSQEEKIALAALKWLVAAKQTLNVLQLTEAATDFPNNSDGPERISPHELVDLLGDLISIRLDLDQHESYYSDEDLDEPVNDLASKDIRPYWVELAHFSVQEYLLSGRLGSSVAHIEFTLFEAHTFVAEWLIAYILCFSVSENSTESESLHQVEIRLPKERRWVAKRNDRERAIIEFEKAFPLLKYCLNYWHEHGTFQRTEDTELVMSVLSSPKAREHLSTMFNETKGTIYSHRFHKAVSQAYKPEESSPLHIAACLGLDTVVRQIFKRGIGTDLNSTLPFVLRLGNVSIVILLLDNGADVNAREGNKCAVQIASEYGHEALLRLLLESGANVNAQGGKYGNALQAACHSVQKEGIVRLLIEYGADVNAQGGRYGNALQAACQSELQEKGIVRLLIEYGAYVNAPGGRYGNALQAACQSHRPKEEIVRLLIEHGADVNARGGKHGNALQAACQVSDAQPSIIKLLLEHGADVNAPGDIYGSALNSAAGSAWKWSDSRERIVRLLIAAGANVELEDHNGRTALSRAALAGKDSEPIRILLESGASLSARDRSGWTALHYATWTGSVDLELITALVDGGASLDAETHFGHTAIALLRREDEATDQPVIDYLLSKGARDDLVARGLIMLPSCNDFRNCAKGYQRLSTFWYHHCSYRRTVYCEDCHRKGERCCDDESHIAVKHTLISNEVPEFERFHPRRRLSAPQLRPLPTQLRSSQPERRKSTSDISTEPNKASDTFRDMIPLRGLPDSEPRPYDDNDFSRYLKEYRKSMK